MGVILAALLFGFIVQIMGSLNRSAAESFQSSYNYEQKVSTTGPLTDVVLLIPIPSRYDPKTGRNVTPIDLSLASFSNFDRSNVSVRIGGVGGVPMLTRSPGQSEPELPEPPGISPVPFILSFNAAEENLLAIFSLEFHGRSDWWVMGWRTHTLQAEPRVQGPVCGAYL